MRDYPQRFITIKAYNMIVSCDNELQIVNLTDDRLGHLRIIHKDQLNEWLNNYMKWNSNAVEE